MKAFSYTVTGGILVFLYTLFLLQFACLLCGIIWKQKKHFFFCLMALVIIGASLVFMRVFNERTEFGFTPSSKHQLPLLENLPIWGLCLYLLVLGFVTLLSVRRAILFRRTALTASAIKESFDTLPSGLCFSKPDGFILLANKKMEELCFLLTGRDLQDARVFWEEIEKISSQACIRLQNQEIWSFHREAIHSHGKPVVQLLAVDISRLYNLSKMVEQSNKQLLQMNRRLKQYGENMDSLVRSREILETKINIHKEMGQALLASRAYLMQDTSDLTEKEILKRWEYISLLLKKEVEPSGEQNEWQQFVNAAKNAGVQIVATGNIPTDPFLLEYLMMAASEALTNAVRHAQANQLYISITENKTGQLTAIFSDNGKKPSTPVTEGGGLSSLRIHFEEAGGSIKINTDPEFHLIVILPPERRMA